MLAKSPLYLILTSVVCIACLIPCLFATQAANDENSEAVYEELARFKYSGGGVIGGVGMGFCPTGFTYYNLEAEEGETRFVLSAAGLVVDEASSELRVIALDKQGKRFESKNKTQASGPGTVLRVTSLICHFELTGKQIDFIVVERKAKQ